MNRTLVKILTVSLLLMFPAAVFALKGTHDPANGGNNYTCNSCHTGSAAGVLYTTNNVCVGCHVGSVDSRGVQNKSFTQNDYVSIGADKDYGASGPGTGAAIVRTPKNTSHKWTGPDTVPAAKALPPTDPYSINQYGLNRRGLTGQVLCVRCHAVHNDSRNNDPVDGLQAGQAPFVRALNNKDQMCMDCHRERETKTHVGGSHPVLVSYTSASVKAKSQGAYPTFYLANGEPRKNTTNPTAEMKNKQSLVVCSSCHGVHYADSDSATFDNHSTSKALGLSTSDGSLLRVSRFGTDNQALTVNLCNNCHIKQHNGQIYQHGNASSKYKIECNDCHNAHVDNIDPTDPVQTPNAFLLRRYMNYSGLAGLNQTVKLTGTNAYRKRAVYTDSNLTTARWVDANGTGICQSCHNLPNDVQEHIDFPANVNKTRVDCMNCHTSDAPHTDTPPQNGGSCTKCHGQPPQLNSQGSPTVPGYSLNYNRYKDEATTPHTSHALGTMTNYGYACNECHLGSTHNNNFVQVFDPAKPPTAGPTASYTVNAPPADSTCSNVYCHSNGYGSTKPSQVAIGWNTGKKGSIIGAGAARCTTCHDNTTISTGSHSKHVTTMGYACITCHESTVSNNTTLKTTAYATGGAHANRKKEIKYSGTGAAIGDAFTIVPDGSNNVLLNTSTCANVMCHSNGKSTGAVVVPTWGNAASGACNTCHRTATSAPMLSTGSHTTHIVKVIGGGNASCATCHTTFISETDAAHVNGIAPTGTCSTCHYDPYSALNLAPSWGTSNPGCGACHNSGGAFTGTGYAPATGSHNKHMAVSGIACADCHAGAIALSTGGGTTHTDGNIDIIGTKVLSGNTTNIPKHSAGSYTTTCANATCHVSSTGTAYVTTPTWGASVGCVSCHTGSGAFTGTGSAPNTGSHNKHMAVVGTQCSDCHSGASVTSYGASTHYDTNIDVIGTKNISGTSNIPKHSSASTLTCANATCHADPYTTGRVTSPTWGVSSGCSSCHTGQGAFTGTGSGPNTGAHNLHMALPSALCNQCHAGAIANTNGGDSHANDVVNVLGGYPTNVVKHNPGSYTGKCSTTLCHGSTSPTWATPSSNDQCTKCHGNPTATINSTNRYFVAPPTNIAGITGTLVGSSSVSTDPKVGAHQTHLRFSNGFSNYSTIEYRCEACHGTLPNASTVVSHADGTSSPQGKFQKLATGFGSTTPTYSGVTCSNVYCHNPSLKFAKLDAGTLVVPTWNNGNYLADGGKSLANCQVCHLVPGSGSFSKQSNHGTMITDTSLTQCNGCHGHSGDNTGALGQRHIDGILYASASDCNSCHDYDTVSATWTGTKWTGGSWGKLNLGAYGTGNQGWGAHAKHINWIKTRLGITVALTATGQTFGAIGTQPATVCGTCHTNSGNHNMNATDGSDPTGRQINFGDSTFKYGGSSGTSFILVGGGGVNNPKYNGTSGTSSNGGAADKTCSNISCHYFTTPLWSTY